METLSIQDLASACSIFMGMSYPEGADTIPAAKRPYFRMSADAVLTEYLPPAPASVGICQDLSKLKGAVPGFEFRLGSAAHPHLKLRVQVVENHQRNVWVYSVDTHDRIAAQAARHLRADEAEAWRILVEKNSALKNQIEDAFAAANLLTPKSLLRLDLTS